MKETELRLNNLVMVNYKTDLLSKVTWIQEGSINVTFDRQPDLVNGIVCSVNDLISIPLTEEWLIKFGFEKTWFGYENISTGIEIEPLKNGDYTICINANEYHVGENFKYVHHLQNIHFALKNKELELIKE